MGLALSCECEGSIEAVASGPTSVAVGNDPADPRLVPKAEAQLVMSRERGAKSDGRDDGGSEEIEVVEKEEGSENREVEKAKLDL